MRLLFLCLGLVWHIASLAKTVYIVPIGGIDTQKMFFEKYFYRDEVSVPFCSLREELEKCGYQVKFSSDGAQLDDLALIISFNDDSGTLLNNLAQYPKEKCVIVITEPPVVLPRLYQGHLSSYFGKIFVMFDNLIDNQRYFKFHYPQPRLQMIDDVPSFNQKQFCILIAGNKDFSHPDALYPERRRVISFYANSQPGELDLYGPDWNGYRDWKGSIPNKWEVLKNYKFNFCYENMGNQEGYITEKIIDSFVGGCVPIYLGATNITDYIPHDCFIDRRAFASDQDLYHFLKQIDEKTYNQYITAIKRYLVSPEAQRFSVNNWLRMFKDVLAELEEK